MVLLRSKRKKHTIEEISIDELLDDLTNTNPRPESRAAEDPWSEEYLTKLHKREARKTLDKYRRDEPIVSEQPKPR